MVTELPENEINHNVHFVVSFSGSNVFKSGVFLFE